MAVRSLFIVVLICTLAWSVSANAQNMSEPKLGTYGYGHEKLHQYGIIPDLLSKTGRSCCDGGHGGECRVTRLRSKQQGGRVTWEFLHHETWCPVTANVRFDVNFPPAAISEGITAVVCAGKTAHNVCPSRTYCAAQNTSPG